MSIIAHAFLLKACLSGMCHSMRWTKAMWTHCGFITGRLTFPRTFTYLDTVWSEIPLKTHFWPVWGKWSVQGTHLHSIQMGRQQLKTTECCLNLFWSLNLHGSSDVCNICRWIKWSLNLTFFWETKARWNLKLGYGRHKIQPRVKKCPIKVK